MENVLLIILLLLALALIGVVLLQRSEGGGLGMGGGGGAMSQRSAATAMTKLTWIFGIGFMICALTITILAARNSEGASVIDRLTDVPAAAEETAPGGTIDVDGLLPPPSTDGAADAPLVPQAD